MFVLQKIRKSVSKIDMFSSSEMLRYNEDAQYRTFTGGIISLGIVLTVISGFFSMISETLNRTAISSSLNIITSGNPSPYNLTNNVENMFMFGIQIQSMDQTFYYNASGPRRYFDVNVIAGTLKYGIIQRVDIVPMVSCTDQHWAMLPDFEKNKDILKYNTWLCPEINYVLPLAGSYFSDIYQTAQISISKCTNYSDPTRPCYPQNEIDDLMTEHGNFYMNINYMNTVVNPNEVDYRSYFIQAMDYVIFSKIQGSQIYYQFSDYQIQTDTSIWPFSSFTVDKGVLSPTRSTGKSYMVEESGYYAYAYLIKSSQSYLYRRQVQKLSVVVSYIGGLVGAISAVLFILKMYTDTSLEVSIAKSLFIDAQAVEQVNEQPHSEQADGQKDKNKRLQQSKQNKFNLIGFIKLNSYRLLKRFKWTESWDEAKHLAQLKQQIGKQLDVKILLKRIMNLQRYLSYVFDERQWECLKHQKPITFQQIQQLRKFFSEQIPREKTELSQQKVIKNTIYKVDINTFNQQLEYSQNSSHQHGVQTAQPLFNHLNQSKPTVNILGTVNLSGNDNLKKRWTLDRSDVLKIEQHFSQLRREIDSSTINRKIWQNGKNVDVKNEKKRSIIKISLPVVEQFE